MIQSRTLTGHTSQYPKPTREELGQMANRPHVNKDGNQRQYVKEKRTVQQLSGVPVPPNVPEIINPPVMTADVHLLSSASPITVVHTLPTNASSEAYPPKFIINLLV